MECVVLLACGSDGVRGGASCFWKHLREPAAAVLFGELPVGLAGVGLIGKPSVALLGGLANLAKLLTCRV
jgi:hypothetical protein